MSAFVAVLIFINPYTHTAFSSPFATEQACINVRDALRKKYTEGKIPMPDLYIECWPAGEKR